MAILIGLLLICAVWAVAASLLIVRDLDKRGIPVSLLWMRLMIFSYLGQYIKITREETGKIGPLFYHYVAPLNTAVIIAIMMIIVGS